MSPRRPGVVQNALDLNLAPDSRVPRISELDVEMTGAITRLVLALGLELDRPALLVSSQDLFNLRSLSPIVADDGDTDDVADVLDSEPAVSLFALRVHLLLDLPR